MVTAGSMCTMECLIMQKCNLRKWPELHYFISSLNVMYAKQYNIAWLVL